MIEFLAHHLVTVYVLAAATAIVGFACSRWLLVAIPVAVLALTAIVIVRRLRRREPS